MDYNFDLSQVINTIRKKKAKLVCLQLADGLKPQAKEIQEKIEKATGAHLLVWLGSCYGGCDYPNLSGAVPKVDLLVQFGHAPFIKTF